MTRSVNIFLACLAAWSTAACATTLPQTRPADLTIVMSRHTGVDQEGEVLGDELVITAGQTAHYTVEYCGGGSISVPLQVTAKMLDGIYELLLEAHLQGIDDPGHLPAQKKGVRVTVQHAQGAFLLTHSASSGTHQKVIQALLALKQHEVDEKGFGIPQVFDHTLFGAALQEDRDPW